jgi:hypothetical protein
MFRLLMIATAMLLSAQATRAHAHGSESAPPPPPKQEGVPVHVAIVKNRPMLIDLKGMTLYYFEQDNTGKTSTCDGKCTERWIPVAASANASPPAISPPSPAATAARCGPSGIARSTARTPTRPAATPTAPMIRPISGTSSGRRWRSRQVSR